VVVALSQPLSGLVFVLDGVLIGAGDGRWLAGAQLAVLVVYLPLVLWVRASQTALLAASDTAAAQAHAVTVLWWAVVAFMLLRGLALGWRARGDAWLVTGAAR
jgi:Na+-driven multidrug efflux pump